MEIYKVSIYDCDSCGCSKERIFNSFEKASAYYNEEVSRYYKDFYGVGIYMSLCEFVDGELTFKMEVARTEY